MERRPLSAGINAIPNTDPETVRQFVTEARSAKPQPSENSEPTSARPDLSASHDPHTPTFPPHESAARRRRTKLTGVTPVGLIPVTVRLRPELAGALKRASLERQLSGEEPFAQQDLVQQALEPWLRSQGYLS